MKAYVAPELVVHGSLGQLTRGWDAPDLNDGQGGHLGKTADAKDGLGTDEGGKGDPSLSPSPPC